MKNQFQLTVNRVDNGFTIRTTEDSPRAAQSLVAKNETEVKQIITELASKLFDSPSGEKK